MKRHLLKPACAAMVLACAATIASADIKIRTKSTTGARSTQSTTWIKGGRLRTSQGVGLDTIDQCDLSRTLVVNDKLRRYVVEFKPAAAPAEAPAQNSGSEHASATPNPLTALGGAKKAKPEPKHGVITYTTTIVDTGERKQMFGFTARHLKLATVAESSADACSPAKTRVESDGWYIDLDAGAACIQSFSAGQSAQPSKSACGDELRYNSVGDARLGFPVLETTTRTDQEGRAQTQTIEVVELSQETLDAALFDVAADYKQVSNYREAAGFAPSPAEGPTDPSGYLEQIGLDPGSIDGVPSTIEPKQQGTIRIGVAAPVNKTDRKFFVPGLRDKLIGAVDGGNVEAVPLRSRSEAEAQPEAKKYNCDYVLFTEIETIKKATPGGTFGKFAKMAGANPLNDKYEARVDYRLYAAGNATPVVASSESAKGGGGVNVMAAIQMTMRFAPMFSPMMFSPMMMMGPMKGGMFPGMPSMLLGRMQGGQSLLMQSLMMNMVSNMSSQGGIGGFPGGPGPGGFGPGGFGQSLPGAGGLQLDNTEELLLYQTFAQEAKNVVTAVQKKQ
ncbi:MAG TPA: hypothetical protein VKJ45_14810 [Blastocatellia bacterium]|nr:hypothetical protein [Blastocatellia bacterium]